MTSLLRHGRVIFFAMMTAGGTGEDPKPRESRPAAFWLAMLVPLGLIAIVGLVIYAIGRLLGG